VTISSQCLREVQRLRLGADDPLVDQVEVRVRAGPGDRARVPDLVAGLEERDRAAGRDHDAGRVVPQDLGLPARVGAGPYLDVDGVDRHGLDPHQQIVLAGRGHWQLEIEQAGRVGDREIPAVAHRAHEFSHGDDGRPNARPELSDPRASLGA
jgi:hypothetical protein